MDFTTALAQGSSHPLLLVATALFLGALHGLEPGHSKTMMAAFIIAVRGTVGQAILLGVSAAASHTVIVWAVALLALHFGTAFVGEQLETWFLLASGVIVVAIGGWMAFQTWQAKPSHKDSPSPHPHSDAPLDAHARAQNLHGRYASGQASSLQTLAFGVTGGFIPCSAAVTVLLLCLQMQNFWLGVTLVGAFSIGLALTLVAAGVMASLGLRYAATRTNRLTHLLARAPYISALLVLLIGFFMLSKSLTHMST